jgi:hypothetical protein
MRRILALVLSCVMVLTVVPISAAGGAQGGTGTISGTTLANYTVRVRNVTTGQLVGSTTSNGSGGFTFTGLAPADYVVELVDAAGNIVGTSAALTVAAGATVNVTLSASALAAAGGGAGAVGGGLAGFFGSALGIVTIAGIGAGITGWIIGTRETASPSR